MSFPYSEENLHFVARLLGIKRCWFHGDHYDIPKRRVSEIMKRCSVVGSKDIVRIKRGDPMVLPCPTGSMSWSKFPGTGGKYLGTAGATPTPMESREKRESKILSLAESPYYVQAILSRRQPGLTRRWKKDIKRLLSEGKLVKKNSLWVVTAQESEKPKSPGPWSKRKSSIEEFKALNS